jgi:phosphatidate phosphatase APP1
MADKKQITCYPTCGYKDNDGAWKISVRVLVHESRTGSDPLSLLAPAAVEVAELFAHRGLDRESAENFLKTRVADFLREGVQNEEVVFKFRDDTNTKSYTVDGLTTDKDGLITDDITLDRVKAPWLAGDGDQWLSYEASVPGGPVGEGRVQLLGAEGVSVISDIDDTIKITEIPAGTLVVALNTFFRPFASVEKPDNMVSMYQGTIPTPGGSILSPNKVSFHYVSGGPWQLYRPLAAYLIDDMHFPAGSFHLRTVNLEHSAIGHWKDLVEVVERAFNLAQPQPDQIQQNDTYKHKIDVIQKLMTALPGRKFLMFGDSGEFDPEVYEAILSQPKFSKMVKETTIREVKGLAPNDPRRLKMRSVNMFVRDAPPIVHGKSQI